MAREMKDSGISWLGQIPESWNTNTVFQIFTQVKNRNTDLQEQNLLSLSYGKIIRKNIETTDGLLPESFDGYNIIEANDIVLRLTDLQNDQRSLRVGLATERGIITSAYLTIRNRSESLAKYLYYFLHSFDISKGFYGMGAGVRQGLNWDGIKWLKVLSPPVPEQRNIVSFLDLQCARIDAVIEKTRASIEEYKKLKQAVITQAVTKGIRPGREMKDSGVEWIGEIVSDYQLVKLKHLLRHQLQYGANQSGVPYDELLPRYIRITDITLDGRLKGTGKLSLSEEDANDYILQDGDVLFARSGATVGKAFIYKKEYGRAAFAGYLIKATLNGELLPDLLFYYTQSSIYDEWKKQIFVQATIQNIGADRYRELPIILHPPEEQREIVSYLATKCSEIDSLIRKKEFLLNEFDSCKKSLIFEYVTGKKEVP